MEAQRTAQAEPALGQAHAARGRFSMTIIRQCDGRFVDGFRITAALLMLAFGTHGVARAQNASLFVASLAQPPNVGDAIIAAAAYKESGAYDRDVASVAQQAADWIGERAPAAARPALVLDIDETALSNWEVITRDNFGRPIAGPCDLAFDGPCGWAAWE
jgi:hypothetical protein